MGWDGSWGGGWSGSWSGGGGDAAEPSPPTLSIRLFGVDMAGLIAQEMGQQLLPATLIKVFPGTRTAGNLAGGTNPVTRSYRARGFTSELEERFIDGDTVKRGDRAVTLLGASIPGRVVPEAGDRLTIEGKTWAVVAIVDRDAAAATYTLAVRG